jgi:methylmalonyl-CoA/ethylmalonyl-CoA epimerase
MSNVVKKIHHVGYLVKDISKSRDVFGDIGYSLEGDIVYDADRKADICFLNMGAVCIELVSPHVESDIYPLLKKYSNAPYHICYEVENLVEAIGYFKQKGFLMFIEEQRALAISDSARVVFMMHARLGMVELVEL